VGEYVKLECRRENFYNGNFTSGEINAFHDLVVFEDLAEKLQWL
jgi:hypothetical protein